MKKLCIPFLASFLIISLTLSAQQNCNTISDYNKGTISSNSTFSKNLSNTPLSPAEIMNVPVAQNDDAKIPISYFNGQQGSTDGAFPKGTNVFNAGVGFGDVFFGTGYETNFPVIPIISWDRSFTDKIGIGNIGGGLMVAYSSTKYTIYDIGTYNSSGLLVALRGTYHFILNNDKLDPYGGVLIGYIFASHGSVPYGGSYYTDFTAKGNSFAPGIFGGIHYYFTPVVGVFGEVGYMALYIGSVGVTFRLLSKK